MTNRVRNRAEGPVTAERFYDLYDATTGVKKAGPVVISEMVTLSSNESIDDVVTSDFNRRSARGEIINNPMIYMKDRVSTTKGGRFTALRGNDLFDFQTPSGCWSADTIQGAPWQAPSAIDKPDLPSNLFESLKAQAMGNIDRSPYSFAEDLGEIRETLQFLRRPFKSLDDLLDELQWKYTRFLSGGGALNASKAFAKAWLEMRFAFIPLVRSASDLVDALTADAEASRPVRNTARAKREFEYSLHDEVTVIHQTNDYSWERSLFGGAEARVGILYEVSNPLMDWKYKYGLRTKDIPETAWAILPYSFMVDRVLDISAAIRGITAFLDPRVKILAGWTTEKSDVTVTRSMVGLPTNSVWTYNILQTDRLSEQSVRYNRQVWSPGFLDAIGPVNLLGLVEDHKKVTDLLSLILTRIGKLPK